MPKVNISLSEEILEQIDKTREKRLTRSEFFRQASELYLRVLEEERREEEKRAGIEEAIRIQNEVRQRVGFWDALAELRKWRELRQ
jgi:metal-responsive CopG/Arc/MetJ family transcriptional regulator